MTITRFYKVGFLFDWCKIVLFGIIKMILHFYKIRLVDYILIEDFIHIDQSYKWILNLVRVLDIRSWGKDATPFTAVLGHITQQLPRFWK